VGIFGHGNAPAIPVWAVVALGVLAVVQITLDVVALVDLYRRPVKQVVFGNKWIWVAIVLLINTVGAIIYLVVARKPVAMPENAGPSASPTVRAQDIADALYGPREDPDQR
jgi:NADH:ubiquinone oxidoreductase subunit 6 (subunit J)